MRKILVIAVREYLASVRSKSFIIGLALMPLLMGAGFAAQILLKDQVDLKDKHFAIIDHTAGQSFVGVIQASAEARNQIVAGTNGAKQLGPRFLLEDATTDGAVQELRYRLSERVRRGELVGILEIGPEVVTPPAGAKSMAAGNPFASLPAEAEPYSLRYQTNRPSYQDFAKWAEAKMTEEVVKRRASAAGMDTKQLPAVLQAVPLSYKGLTTRNAQGELRDGDDQNPVVAILLPGGLIALMFMLILLGAAPLLQGVIEEKMQRIAEVLLGSVSPFGLMMGKLIGMVGVSLTLGSIYLAGAYVAARQYGYAEYLPGDVIAWFLLYQVLAVCMFGSLYAAVGAACTDMKEAQAMLTPITLVAIVPMFIWVNVVREPTSTFALIASLIPPATPTLMLVRQAVPPGIPVWQPICGVVLMVATTLLCVYAAGRIFRVGILMQGKGARFADLVRWVIRG
jgi:ABC-2 type transport system permease protein